MPPSRLKDSFISFRLHPATLILLWSGGVFAAQELTRWGLATLALPVLALSFLLAEKRMRGLLYRTRWLFLSVLLLFVFSVPGERLPGLAGDIGITFDGIAAGGDHLLRLLLLLTSLALLHESLGTSGLVSGLYWLLIPLGKLRGLREKIIIRLLLVLDYVETDAKRNWSDWFSVNSQDKPVSFRLAIRSMPFPEWVLLGILIFGIMIWFSI